MKIQAVLFDLDGTLLDRASSIELFLNQQYDRFAKDLLAIKREIYVKTVIKLDAYGHVPKPKVYDLVRSEFQFAHDLAGLLLEDYEEKFPPLAIQFPGMHEALRELVSMNLCLGLVTNGAVRSQRPKIEALKIGGYFKTILISEEQGVRKPDPEIYLRALKKLDCCLENTVFIGDHPDTDIEGAAKLGIKTIWKRNNCWNVPKRFDAAIDQLEEIPAIIRTLSI